uniref:Uncharacterized protein n=1 Tax=Strigamia maritima TaxID=126957 RepID=T1JG02_STRMM
MNRPQELGTPSPIEVVPLMGRPTWAETYAGGSAHTTQDMYFASRYNHNNKLELPPRLWSSCSEPLLLTCDLDSPPPASPLSPGIPSSPPPPQLPSSHRTSSIPGSRQVRPRNRNGETEQERKRMSICVGICATSIFVTAFLLVAITLRMTPQIDEMSVDRWTVGPPSTELSDGELRQFPQDERCKAVRDLLPSFTVHLSSKTILHRKKIVADSLTCVLHYGVFTREIWLQDNVKVAISDNSWMDVLHKASKEQLQYLGKCHLFPNYFPNYVVRLAQVKRKEFGLAIRLS